MVPLAIALLAVLVSSLAQDEMTWMQKAAMERHDFPKNKLGQVVFSHVLFRHGSRMPLDFYPNDPYKDPSNWPFKVAQLTDIGKKQEYELGSWLRLRYNSLLSKRYDLEEIYVESTDVDRTLMSAECVMGGLYGQKHVGRRDYIWDPIPVHTMPVLHDCVLGATSTCPCPAYNAEVQRVRSLPEVQALEKKFENMYDYVSNHTGGQVRDFGGAVKIYDALSIEEEYNLTLPDWAHKIYPEPITEAALYSFVLPTWTTLLQRFKIGPLLKEMAERFQAKRSGTLTPDRTVWFYSAHDATISAFLNTLKVFDLHFPPFAACVLLELRKINEEYFVTLMYRNSTAEPQLLPIKTCSTLCPLDQFLTLVQPLLPDNWAKECQLPDDIGDKYLWLTATAVLVIAVTLLVTFLIVYLKKRKSSRTYVTMPVPFNGSSSVKNNYLKPDFTYQLPH